MTLPKIDVPVYDITLPSNGKTIKIRRRFLMAYLHCKEWRRRTGAVCPFIVRAHLPPPSSSTHSRICVACGRAWEKRAKRGRAQRAHGLSCDPVMMRKLGVCVGPCAELVSALAAIVFVFVSTRQRQPGAHRAVK